MNKSMALTALLLTVGLNTVTAQINVGSTAAPDASAMLQVTSTTGGFRQPQVSLTSTTSFQLATPTVTNAALGMMVYNTNPSITGSPAYPAYGKGPYKWDGTGWIAASKTPIVFEAANGATSAAVANTVASADLQFGTIFLQTADVTVNTADSVMTFVTPGTYKIDVTAIANITANNTGSAAVEGVEYLYMYSGSTVIDDGVFAVAPISTGYSTVGVNYLMQYSSIAQFAAGKTLTFKGNSYGMNFSGLSNQYQLLSVQISRVK